MANLSLPSDAPKIESLAVGPDGLQIIEKSESLSLKAYPDPATKAEPITIGYGHTGGVRLGETITLAQAEAFLASDVHSAAECIKRTLGPDTQLPQKSFDALVSLTFNIGNGNFEGSTVAKCAKAGNYQGAADAFLSWNKARVDGVLTPMGGLNTRRALERGLFLAGFPGSEDVQSAPQPNPTPAPDSPRAAVVKIQSSRRARLKQKMGLVAATAGTAANAVGANALAWAEPVHQAGAQIDGLGVPALHHIATGLTVAGIGLTLWGHLDRKCSTTVSET